MSGSNQPAASSSGDTPGMVHSDSDRHSDNIRSSLGFSKPGPSSGVQGSSSLSSGSGSNSRGKSLGSSLYSPSDASISPHKQTSLAGFFSRPATRKITFSEMSSSSCSAAPIKLTVLANKWRALGDFDLHSFLSTNTSHVHLRSTTGSYPTFEGFYIKASLYLSGHAIFREFMLEQDVAPWTTSSTASSNSGGVDIKKSYTREHFKRKFIFLLRLTKSVKPSPIDFLRTGILPDIITWKFELHEIMLRSAEDDANAQAILRARWSDMYWSKAS